MRQAALHLRSRPLILEAKKMAPTPQGAMKKIPEGVRVEEGRALARLGDGGWDPLVRPGRREGRFADELVEAAAEAVRSWGVPVAWVTAVPSRRSGELVPDFARRLAERARAALRARARAHRRRAAAARDGQLPAAGGQRARAVRGHRRAAGGPVPARRRHPLQRLDAGDGRRPAARPRRAGRSTRSRSRPRSSSTSSRGRAARSAPRAEHRARGRAQRATFAGWSGANTRQPCLAPAIRPVVPAG